ncbi:restriction endonuclease subunit S [Pseudomonas proteolytica]|uniref:restriction endonuclease subunit S n=1 Tax=Pseudomonas proteolytica TaxID=219574 RepID=UPI001475B41E|nr:restriction endonuclease subunit S [Pseudomonas proteolytica]NMZ08308.1 restriction endonuclease subunit S [Pseudomonas proteolytica]
MGSEVQWLEKPLGAVTCNHDGKRKPVKESERKKGPYPYYGASGIVDYVDGYLFEGRHLLIAEDGENLRTRQTPIAFMADGKFWVNNHAHIVTGNGEVTTEYLLYFLQNADIQSYLTGAVMPKLTQGNLNRIPVRYPEPDYQRSIVRALGALDSKIDLNLLINQTLEAIAQAIFKSWFVDFEPVKAKLVALAEDRDPLRAAMSAISGKPDAELDMLLPEQYEQLAATAALFPDEMEKSELGEIPRGWQVQRVGSVLELVYGKALKSTDRQKGNVPVYGSGGITGYHNTPLVQHGSIIVGRKGTVGSLYWEDKPFFPIDTTYYVRPLAAPLTFCYYAMQTLGLEKMNTDAAVPGLNRENVYRLELVLPDVSVLKKFDLDVSTLRKAIRANAESNKALANLRDSLLPKFLSGELSVTEAMAEAET